MKLQKEKDLSNLFKFSIFAAALSFHPQDNDFIPFLVDSSFNAKIQSYFEQQEYLTRYQCTKCNIILLKGGCG